MGLKDKHLAEGEHIVLDLRTHWKALVGPLALAIFLVALVWVLWYYTNAADIGGWITLGAGILAGMVVIGYVLVPLWRWNSERYVVTNRRISHRSGLFTKVGRDIPLHRVNDVSTTKDPLDRVLGCGTLIVSDASDKAGMELRDVPRVEQVQVQIQTLLFRADDGSDDRELNR